MQVLENQEDRSILRGIGEQIGGVEDEQPASSMRVAAPGIRVFEALGQGRPEWRQGVAATHRPSRVDEDRGGHLEIAWVRPSAHGAQTGCQRPALDRTDQPGLPDPRLAGDKEQVSVTSEHLGQAAVGQFEHVITTDGDRADDRPIPLHHRSSVGPRWSRPSVG
jgi:hypothetical protein